MSADGSIPSPGRNLTDFRWRVMSVPDGRVVAEAAGRAGSLRLPVGRYTAKLTVADSRGGGATATKEFSVGASSDPSAKSSGDLDRSALAVVSLPPPAVARASGAGLTRVPLDAAGSAPAQGARLVNVLWAVVALPGREAAANATGEHAEVWLPPGDYQVSWVDGEAGRQYGYARRGLAEGEGQNLLL